MQDVQNYVELEIPMSEDMVVYLGDVIAKANASPGVELDYSSVLRAVIGFLMDLDVDISGCASEDDVLLAIKRSVLLRCDQ